MSNGNDDPPANPKTDSTAYNIDVNALNTVCGALKQASKELTSAGQGLKNGRQDLTSAGQGLTNAGQQFEIAAKYLAQAVTQKSATQNK